MFHRSVDFSLFAHIIETVSFICIVYERVWGKGVLNQCASLLVLLSTRNHFQRRAHQQILFYFLRVVRS